MIPHRFLSRKTELIYTYEQFRGPAGFEAGVCGFLRLHRFVKKELMNAIEAGPHLLESAGTAA